jgi:hypothetical protein
MKRLLYATTLSLSKATDTLSESLKIYKYPQNLALLEFEYDISLSLMRHFDLLFEQNLELEWFEFQLVQGRWNEQFVKKFNGY